MTYTPSSSPGQRAPAEAPGRSGSRGPDTCLPEGSRTPTSNYIDSYYINSYYINSYYTNSYYINSYCINSYYINSYYINSYYINSYSRRAAGPRQLVAIELVSFIDLGTFVGGVVSFLNMCKQFCCEMFGTVEDGSAGGDGSAGAATPTTPSFVVAAVARKASCGNHS